MTTVHFRDSSEMDAAFRTIVDAHSHASLNAPPEHPSSAAVVAGVVAEGAVAATELAEVAGVHFAPVVGTLGVGVAGPLAALYAGCAEVNHAWEEHERNATDVDHHQMHGAMLYVLGRIPEPDRPEVERDFGTHERDGARDARTWERERPEAYAALRDRVLTHYHDGEMAVFDGTDHSPEAEARYGRDPIFRLAVDEARALRESDPDAFGARAREAHAMRDEVGEARVAVAVRA